MRALTRLLALALMASLMLPLAAHASSKTFEDKKGDGEILDITSVRVHNSKKKVVVRVNWKNHFPEYKPAGAVKLWIDTNPKKKGPEFLYVVDHPGHLSFYPVKNWKPQYNKAWFGVAGEGKCGKAVTNEFSLKKRYSKVTLKARKGCIGKPKKVRAAAKTEEWGYIDADYNFFENPETVVDWYKGKKKMTDWVKR